MPLDFNFIDNILGVQDIKVTFVNVNDVMFEVGVESNLKSVIYFKLFKATISHI
ncbi:hypothetical protein SAMN02745163_00221 [Clostridium cavendishii DSM 21758]|uniref:Uncharacterized protein n=1 Tax=Clostridium cavendishii DSM 21758 TaxID=1121302 RepID=A0A1M6B0P8_9CLOT|nr:hypothetical protein [Clostridium cavendishii]SHI42043.1 hypothetical protein SAMN02745163_00221 [Clostridium cavendishii DSM 21758]